MNYIRSLLSAGLRGIRRPTGARIQQTSSLGSKPRILVDVSVIIRNDARTGIQRVVRAVWSHLLELSGSTFEVVPVYAAKTHGYRYARLDFLSQPVAERCRGMPVKIGRGDRFLGLDLSAHILPSHRRQLRGWRARGATVHLVVYDLLPLQRPEWFTDKAVSRFKRWFEVVRNECDEALCISDYVADSLRERISPGSKSPAIGRLKLAGDIDGSQPSYGIDEETAAAIVYAESKPALLMVGTIEPRKAYDVALAAFDKIWGDLGDSAPALIIAGKPGWRTEALQKKLRSHPEAGRKLHWLTNVSDEGLALLFSVTRGVIHASYAEGFGLPAIEAAMHKKHALVRDLPVFREQGLSNLRYFDEDEPVALASRIMALVEEGPVEEARLPSWAECVSDLISRFGVGPTNSIQAPHVVLLAS